MGDLLATRAHNCVDTTVPSGLVVALLFFAWLSSFFVFFLIWFLTRTRPRAFPACGVHVPRSSRLPILPT